VAGQRPCRFLTATDRNGPYFGARSGGMDNRASTFKSTIPVIKMQMRTDIVNILALNSDPIGVDVNNLTAGTN
jgi:hypothetical protein